jgi:mannan endo-1,4-beta-mannosidase
VTITNTGAAALTGWTLAFTFGAGQRVSEGWAATWTQPAGSANVTAVNMPWNGNLAPNASTGIGFNGSFTGTANPAPVSFTINGNTCTIT